MENSELKKIQDGLDWSLRERILDRLAELKRSPITAATSVGLERTYLRDFVKGKKDSLRSDKYDQVAQALDWSVSQLLGVPALQESLRKRQADLTAMHAELLKQIPGDQLV